MNKQVCLILLLVAFTSCKWMQNSNFLSKTNKHLQDGWPSPKCVKELTDMKALKFQMKQRKVDDFGSQLVFTIYFSNGINQCVDEESATQLFYLTDINDKEAKNQAKLNDLIENDQGQAAHWIPVTQRCDDDRNTQGLCGTTKGENWYSTDTNYKEGEVAAHSTSLFFKYDQIVELKTNGFLESKSVAKSTDRGPVPNYDETTVLAQMIVQNTEGEEFKGAEMWMDFSFSIRKYTDDQSRDPFDFSARLMETPICENSDCFVDKHFQICSEYIASDSNWNQAPATLTFNKLSKIYIKFLQCGNDVADYMEYKVIMTKFSMVEGGKATPQVLWTPSEAGRSLTFHNSQMWDAEAREIRVVLQKISRSNIAGQFIGDFRAVKADGTPVTKSETKAASYESFDSSKRSLTVDPPISNQQITESVGFCDEESEECMALTGNAVGEEEGHTQEEKTSWALYLAMGAFALAVVAVVVVLVLVKGSGKSFEEGHYLQEDYNEIE